MLLNSKLCADAGTVNCPCYLAEYGKCLVCSRLGGSGNCSAICSDGSGSSGAGAPMTCMCDSGKALMTCDCQWQGMCIYNEYLQNNQCIKNKKTEGSSRVCGSSTGERRMSLLCKIQKIKWFKDDLAVMRISVPRGMAEKAALPGSFVFVKAHGMENCFELPVSVLRNDYEGSALEIAVKVLGPKSRALLDNYRNTAWPGVNSCDAADGLQTGDVGSGIVYGAMEHGLLIGDVGLERSDGTADGLQTGDVGSEIVDSAMEHGLPIGDSRAEPLERSEYGYVELRGIYRNGLLGANKLMTAGKIEKIAGDSATFGNTVTASTDGTEISEAGKRRVLCLTKGAGIAPVANYIRWAEGKDRIDVIADLDKISREFAEYALGMTGLCGQACDEPDREDGICGQACEEPDRADGLCGQGGCELQAGREQSDVANGLESVTYGPLPLNLSWTESEKYDVIIISASDFYQQNIYVPEAKKVLSNNHTMCCGEGICGACMCMDAMGKEHRSCKECRV